MIGKHDERKPDHSEKVFAQIVLAFVRRRKFGSPICVYVVFGNKIPIFLAPPFEVPAV